MAGERGRSSHVHLSATALFAGTAPANGDLADRAGQARAASAPSPDQRRLDVLCVSKSSLPGKCVGFFGLNFIVELFPHGILYLYLNLYLIDFMHKKLFLLLAILLIIALSASLFLFLNLYPADSGEVTEVPARAALPVHQMQGLVLSVKDKSIVVEGLVGETNESVEFAILPSTVIKKNVIGISVDQIKSGKPFTPKTTSIFGKISDLTPKTHITKITTKDNLSLTKKVSAEEIDYITYDIPK